MADHDVTLGNLIEGGDGTRFQRVLGAVVGKRITYRVLTARDDAGFMGIR